MVALTANGYLPEGIHDLTIDEIGGLFATHGRTGRRIVLFEHLQAFCREAATVEGIESIVVDGSFITAIEEPGDIDLLVVLKAGRAVDSEWRPADYNVVSRRRVRRRFSFDLLVARADGPELDGYLEYYSQIKGVPGARKGLVRLRT